MSQSLTNHNQDALHLPVLADEVLSCLSPKPGESYLDLTAGYGGHASRILELTRAAEKSVLVDRDEFAIAALTEKFGSTVRLLHEDFAAATGRLTREGRHFDLVLADLGVSSPHLNDAGRGFSISADGPLDMRMDPSQALTAEEVVNSYPEERLAEILSAYGEEPKAKQIARSIVAARPLKTTHELAEVAAKAWPGHSKVHPATRTFQAVRIAVNNELELLEKGLPEWINLLTPGGRIAIISFQSLEDRIVKKLLNERAGDRYDADIQLLTKRPIIASHTELVHNPRARSAKLRAAVKTKK